MDVATEHPDGLGNYMNDQDRKRLARLLTQVYRMPRLGSNFTGAIMAIARPDMEDPELDLDELEEAVTEALDDHMHH